MKEGAGYTTPPTPLFHNGGYTDPATGWTSPTDGGLAGDYDSGIGDALDEAALSGRNGLYRGMLGKASQIAGIGLDLGDFIASFNPICNAFTVATGQKASGRCASIVDRIFAGLSIIPEGAVAGGLGRLVKPIQSAIGRLKRAHLPHFPYQVRTSQVALPFSDLENVEKYATKMRNEKFKPFGPKGPDDVVYGQFYQGPNGQMTYYVETGTTRMTAAYKVWIEDGNDKYVTMLINHGKFTEILTPYPFSAPFPLPIRR